MDNNSSVTEKKVPWYLGRPAVIWALLIVGPLALPLLCFSSKFSMTAKVVIIVSTLLLTFLSFAYAPMLMEMLMARLQSGEPVGV